MTTIAEDPVSRAILDRLVAQATGGGLAFPTSSQVAIRVLHAMNDPDCSADSAARLIQAEPLLATKVLALANSAAYNRSDNAITDIRSAVLRVGLRMVQALATSVACRQMARKADTPSRQRMASQLWEHSAHVAALASVIARHLTGQPADTALFAGMVHELGGFYLLSRSREFPELTDEKLSSLLLQRAPGKPPEDEETDADEHWAERAIGQAVLTALSVPEPVLAAIQVLWQGTLALPLESLGDTLMLADQLASVRSPFSGQWGRDAEAPAAELDVLIGEETLLGMLRESAGEVESLTSALRL